MWEKPLGAKSNDSKVEKVKCDIGATVDQLSAGGNTQLQFISHKDHTLDCWVTLVFNKLCINFTSKCKTFLYKWLFSTWHDMKQHLTSKSTYKQLKQIEQILVNLVLWKF